MEDVKAFYSEVASRYDKTYGRVIDRAEDMAIYRQIGQLIAGRSVVDLGCGTAPLFGRMSALQYPGYYHGIDLSFRMLAEAEDRLRRCDYPVSQYQLSAGDMAYPMRGSFRRYDVAISTFGAMSYPLSLARAAGTMRGYLHEGGRFFVMLYGLRYMDRLHYIARGRGLGAHYVTAARARSIFRDAGFRGVTVRGFNLWEDEAVDGALDVYASDLAQRLRWQMNTTGRLTPDLGYFLVVTGRR